MTYRLSNHASRLRNWVDNNYKQRDKASDGWIGDLAHRARKSDHNPDREVIVVRNEDMLDETGNESETIGQAFIESIGLPGTWIQTSYNGNFRGKYAGQGDTYDEINDVFITPVVEAPAE